MNTKISSAQMAEVFRDASTTLRAQQAHINELETKLASRDQRDRVTKLASEMHRKGLELDTDVGTLADRLEKAAEAGKLDAIEVGVDLVGPDMGQKLASLTNDDGPGASSAASDFERYIVGTAG
jgi:hypothetical protein